MTEERLAEIARTLDCYGDVGDSQVEELIAEVRTLKRLVTEKTALARWYQTKLVEGFHDELTFLGRSALGLPEDV